MKKSSYAPPVLLRAAVLLTGLLIAVSAGAGQGKEDAAVKQVALPAKVLDAFRAKFPTSVIVKQTREEEDGKEVYDIEFTQGGVKHEADLSADGTFLNWEKALSVRELPAPVVSALLKKYPKALIKEAMAVTEIKGGRETLEGYEVLLTMADKKEQEILIAPDGKVLEESGGGD
jgi:hypothetical protein